MFGKNNQEVEWLQPMLVGLVNAVFLPSIAQFPVNKVSSKEDKSDVLSYKNSISKALKRSETWKIESI